MSNIYIERYHYENFFSKKPVKIIISIVLALVLVVCIANGYFASVALKEQKGTAVCDKWNSEDVYTPDYAQSIEAGNSEQTEWIKKLFDFRLANSGQHIGWSAAWAICLGARLRDAERVHSVIRGMLAHSVFKNLFCVHPPFYFQIDGNLGFVAGINEMLITEENGVVELIPALFDNFAQSGSVRDMVVNGSKISFKWQNGLVIEMHSDKPISVLNRHLSDNVIFDENIIIKESV